MIILFIKKFWRELLLAAALFFAGYMVYDKIYERGFEKAQKEHVDYVKNYTKAIDEKIDRLETLSRDLYAALEIADTNRKQDLQKIIKAASKGPLTIYKDGKCTPSEEFLDSYNSVINRANSK